MKQRFVESFSISASEFKKLDRDLSSFKESGSKKLQEEIFSLPETKTIWEVPISRVDVKNANGRIYPRSLWERVIKEQKHIWEGSPMLLDHPSGDEEGSTRNIGGVWLNARIDESGVVWGTLVFTKLGENIEDAINLGLRCGTSSSGFGECQRDGVTVDPETYEIERLSDAVLNPSQGTYFNLTHKQNKTQSKVEDSSGSSSYQIEREFLESTNDKQKEATNAPTNSAVKEKRMEFSRMEERRIRNEIASFLEETESKKDPQIRLEEMTDILNYVNSTENVPEDIKKQVKEKVDAEKANIQKLLTEAVQIKQEFAVNSPETLKKGVEFLSEEIKIIESEAKDYLEIIKKLQENNNILKGVLASRPTSKYVESLVKKLNKLTVDTNKALKLKDSELNKKNSIIKEKNNIIDNMNSEIVELQEMVEHRDLGIKTLKESTDKFKFKYSEASKKLEVLEEKHQKEISRIKEEMNPKPAPKFAERIGAFVDLDESNDVLKYYQELLEEYGSSVKQFKSSILQCRSMREAESVFVKKVLPSFTEVAPLTESISLNREERKQMLESQGMKFDSKPDVISKTLSKNGFR